MSQRREVMPETRGRLMTSLWCPPKWRSRWAASGVQAKRQGLPRGRNWIGGMVVVVRVERRSSTKMPCHATCLPLMGVRGGGNP